MSKIKKMRKLKHYLKIATVVLSIIAAIVSFVGGDIALGNTYVIIAYLLLCKIRNYTGKISLNIDADALKKAINKL